MGQALRYSDAPNVSDVSCVECAGELVAALGSSPISERRAAVRELVRRGRTSLSREGRAHCLLNALRAMGGKVLYPRTGFRYTEAELDYVEAARSEDARS